MAKILIRTGKIGIYVMIPMVCLGAVLYVVNHMATAQVESDTLIGIQKDLFTEAQSLRQTDQIPEAEVVYRRIMTEQAGSSVALDAARERVLMYIEDSDGVAAQQAIEDLATGFAPYVGYPKALLDIGDKYRQFGKTEQAGAMYEYILKTYPKDENAIWSQMGLAMLRISDSKENIEIPEIQTLVTDFAQDPQLPHAACLVADAYRSSGYYQGARDLYKQVISTWPAAEHALWSKMGVVIADIQMNQLTEAHNLTADILTDHAEDERTENIACQIGDAWRKKGLYAEANVLYRYVIEQRPATEHALWSQMGIVISELALKNEPNAAVGVQELLKNHSKDNRIANAACQIADRYQEFGDHKMAKALYTYVVTAWPKEEHAIWCQKGLAVSEEKTDPNSMEHMDRLLKNFGGHANLPLAAFLVGEGYRDAALKTLDEGKIEEAAKGYRRAVEAWEHIIQLQPETAYTPEAFYILAECNYMAGDYERAIYLYQYVAEKWPDFKLAWHSQFMVGYRYQQLKHAGLLEGKAADLQTTAAFKAVLVGYPTCPAAAAATDWLNNSGIW